MPPMSDIWSVAKARLGLIRKAVRTRNPLKTQKTTDATQLSVQYGHQVFVAYGLSVKPKERLGRVR